MTYFAFEGGVGQDAVDGAIEISPAQYLAAIDAMQRGMVVTVSGGAFDLASSAPEPEPEEEPEPTGPVDLVAYVAHTRWMREVSGITVPIGGEDVPVSTDRGDDRHALHTNYSAIVGGLRRDGAAFKFADGVSRAVSNDDMMTAILAALAHVQHCFDLELQALASIAAGNITTTGEIDAFFAAGAAPL
ncbi:hypothetical protein [Mesorhizobium sp. KR2-14]|uniref:DUF4376 domain-containing protein n=1 Tax=Mesorhizobium sp. KR2-14 TaxID=3156610 RepID=UPI0032B59A55